MSWFQNFQLENRRKPHRRADRVDPFPVPGIKDIPVDAHPGEPFRVAVTVLRVYERTTKAGETCYFLKCQDAQASTFSVVVWDWQWERLQEHTTEGSRITLDVRVPKEEYSAFTLA